MFGGSIFQKRKCIFDLILEDALSESVALKCTEKASDGCWVWIHVYGNDAEKLIITKENRNVNVEEVSQAEVNSHQEVPAEDCEG